jgi:sulfate permease, SulP family
VDVTAARMLSQLTADLQREGVRVVMAGEIGQVRDMLALVGDPAGAPQYFRSVQEAVNAVRPGPYGRSGKEK